MSGKIHPNAVVHPSAVIHENVEIGPGAVVGADVTIGSGSKLHPFSHIVCNTTIGENCEIHSGAVVGGDPQDLKFKGEKTFLTIGDRNQIRECVTINRGTGAGGGKTVIGNENLIMAYVHIAHDCVLGNRVIITNSTGLAGHIHIEDMAIISGMSAIHHFVTIGSLAFVAGMSGVRHDVPPYVIVDGHKDYARVRALNIEGLKRKQTPKESIEFLKEAFKIIYRRELTLAQAFSEIETSGLGNDPYVRNLVEHLHASQDGHQGRALEKFRTDNSKNIAKSESE